MTLVVSYPLEKPTFHAILQRRAVHQLLIIFNDFVVISNGTNSLEYGLGTYSAALNNSDSKLQKMLLCMSEYSSAAKIYISKK